jgi:alginate O-acetyltransferase complex protein AlgI
MTVPSWQFLAFALAGAALFNALPWRWARDALWFALNLAFVWSFTRSLAPLLPLAGFLALGYLGMTAARSGRGRAATVATVLVLAAFIWLKRYSFIPAALLLPPGYLAVGLSYIFFRVLHVVIDAGEGAGGRIGIVQYLNYTLNFPAFVSGPIQRWEDYRGNGALPLTLAEIGWSAWRIVLGAFKVLILSEVLQGWQHAMLAALAPGQPLGARALTGALVVVLYTLFLYANFSGYTDFVIGVARLYRLRLPENFDRPFGAPNFIEFWNRWHISLSQWLRSYVFSPLLMAGMRRYKSPWLRQYLSVFALLVTFFLVGVWHGQTSEFLFFGLLQGGGVAGNRLYQVAMARRLSPAGYQRLGESPLYAALARGLTFTWFSFTLLWFWDSWQGIGTLAAALGPAGAAGAVGGTVAAASLLLAVPDAAGPVAARLGAAFGSRYARTAFASVMLVALAVAALILKAPAPEIVYKQF